MSTTNLILSPDTSIDLQVHTDFSDGGWTPKQLIDYLVREQFSLAAITDHDRVDTAAALQQLALEKHLPVLVAAEMSASWQGGMTDVLCFGFDPNPNALSKLAQNVLQRQQENTREVYDNLLRKGYSFHGHPEALSVILEKPAAQQPKELAALLKNFGKHPTSKGCLYIKKLKEVDTKVLKELVHESVQSMKVS